MGFASALDQNMQSVETSATSLSQFITKIYQDPAKFARIAGKDVKEFSDLLKTDANQAVKDMLLALNEKGGFTELAPVFKEMGLSGKNATNVLSTLAAKMEQVNEAQKAANDSLRAGVSVTNEYDIKNNNLQARLDKAKKAFQETALQLGEKLNPILLKSTNATTYLIKAMVELPKTVSKYSAAFITAGLSIAAYTLVIKGYSMATATSITVTNGFGAAVVFVEGAFKKLKVALASNPLGLLLVVATALAAVFQNLYNKATALSKNISETAKQIASAKVESNLLFDALEKTTKGTAEYDKILGILKSKYPEYLKGLIDETGNLNNIAEARKRVNEELEKEIVNKRLNESLTEIATKKMDEQFDVYQNLSKQMQAQNFDSRQITIILDRVREMVKGGRSVADIMNELYNNGVKLNQKGGNWITTFKDNIEDLLEAERVAAAETKKLQSAYKNAFGSGEETQYASSGDVVVTAKRPVAMRFPPESRRGPAMR
jgi:hypothetical protein